MLTFLFRRRYPVNIRGLKALANPTLCRLWLASERELRVLDVRQEMARITGRG